MHSSPHPINFTNDSDGTKLTRCLCILNLRQKDNISRHPLFGPGLTSLYSFKNLDQNLNQGIRNSLQFNCAKFTTASHVFLLGALQRLLKERNRGRLSTISIPTRQCIKNVFCCTNYGFVITALITFPATVPEINWHLCLPLQNHHLGWPRWRSRKNLLSLNTNWWPTLPRWNLWHKICWYCWWKKSSTPWDVKKPVKWDELRCRISSINSMLQMLSLILMKVNTAKHTHTHWDLDVCHMWSGWGHRKTSINQDDCDYAGCKNPRTCI